MAIARERGGEREGLVTRWRREKAPCTFQAIRKDHFQKKGAQAPPSWLKERKKKESKKNALFPSTPSREEKERRHPLQILAQARSERGGSDDLLLGREKERTLPRSFSTGRFASE